MPPQLTPTILAYTKGFAAIAPLHANHLALLRFHYKAPDRTRTATQLAEGVGYDGYSAVNLQYGLLAARLGEAMEFADASLSLLYWSSSPNLVSTTTSTGLCGCAQK